MNMKTTTAINTILIAISVTCLQAQTATAPAQIVQLPKSKSNPIPKFLVYQHFLAWANSLDEKALATDQSDPYKFAEPFQRARLETQDLDAVRKEAKALDADLKKHNQRLKALIAEYRKIAQNNLDHGLAIPPPPAEVHDLEAMRTAIMVQHMVSLQSALGPQKTVQLESFLDREFVPHISLKPLAGPPASIASAKEQQSFAIGQQ
jgi:hypothetical protein